MEAPGAADFDAKDLEYYQRRVEKSQISTLILAAMTIGAAVAVIGLVVSGLVIYLSHDTAPFVWLLIPLAVIGGLVTGATLCIRWVHEAATRAWRLESEDRYYLLQLRQDAPAPPRAQVQVELTQPGDGPSRQTQIADLDASPEQLRRLAEGLLGGAPMSESAWTGAGRPFLGGNLRSSAPCFYRVAGLTGETLTRRRKG